MNSISALHAVSDREFLRKAWKEISKRNMHSRGSDNITIKAFKNRLDENLNEISGELRANRYVFNKLRAHAIKKPGSPKQRPLQIPSVRDRVVMKAIAMFIEPAFRQFNLECSFAFIKGRGVSHAIKRIHELVTQGQKFYFEADIINFFGMVDRQVLWTMFSRQVRHKSLLPLLRQCFNLELEDLQSYHTEFQDLFFGAGSGIPQGGVLSPMLANFYLYEFDKRMLRQGFNLIRYADDFVVMCESPERARQAHQLSKDTLKALNLEIHALDAPDSKSRIGNFSSEGLLFLGVRFKGQEVFPGKKTVQRFESKIKEVLKRNSGDTLFRTIQRLTNLINGWGKCYQSMRVMDLYLSLDEFIKSSVEEYLKNIGVCLIGKNKRKHMKLLGIPSLGAMVEHKPRLAADRTANPPSIETSAQSGCELTLVSEAIEAKNISPPSTASL